MLGCKSNSSSLLIRLDLQNYEIPSVKIPFSFEMCAKIANMPLFLSYFRSCLNFFIGEFYERFFRIVRMVLKGAMGTPL